MSVIQARRAIQWWQRRKTPLIISAIALHLIGLIHGQESPEGGRVMTWVPPYGMSTSKKRLNQSFDGIGMKDGLTHIGLQFWSPTSKGGIELVDRFEEIDESTISEFRKWGDTHGVRIMLCIYNGSASGWDWDLAKTAFDDHGEKFVESLVSETLRLNLDGIDLDLEGNGELDESRAAFVKFIKVLSKRLHAEDKELTVDSFAYKWHAPNQSWWPEILPHVDALHVMGYAETGVGAAGWRSYEFIKAAAGDHSCKLLIGVPSNAAEWQKVPARKHLGWIYDDASVGLAIWDAQLKAPAWRSKDMWQMVSKIKNGAEQGLAAPSATAVVSKVEGQEKPDSEFEGSSH